MNIYRLHMLFATCIDEAQKRIWHPKKYLAESPSSHLLLHECRWWTQFFCAVTLDETGNASWACHEENGPWELFPYRPHVLCSLPSWWLIPHGRIYHITGPVCGWPTIMMICHGRIFYITDPLCHEAAMKMVSHWRIYQITDPVYDGHSIMMTHDGRIFHITDPLCGEAAYEAASPHRRPVMVFRVFGLDPVAIIWHEIGGWN